MRTARAVDEIVPTFRNFARRIGLRLLPIALVLGADSAALASDTVYFSSNTNVTNILVTYINNETVRIDLSSWYLSEHAISIAVANRFRAGVPVRIIGDRAAPFEIDLH